MVEVIVNPPRALMSPVVVSGFIKVYVVPPIVKEPEAQFTHAVSPEPSSFRLRVTT